jgi:hypothetical protein
MRRTVLLATVALVMAAMLVFMGPAYASHNCVGCENMGACQEFGEFVSSEAQRQGSDFGQEVSEDARGEAAFHLSFNVHFAMSRICG